MTRSTSNEPTINSVISSMLIGALRISLRSLAAGLRQREQRGAGGTGGADHHRHGKFQARPLISMMRIELKYQAPGEPRQRQQVDQREQQPDQIGTGRRAGGGMRS